MYTKRFNKSIASLANHRNKYFISFSEDYSDACWNSLVNKADKPDRQFWDIEQTEMVIGVDKLNRNSVRHFNKNYALFAVFPKNNDDDYYDLKRYLEMLCDVYLFLEQDSIVLFNKNTKELKCFIPQFELDCQKTFVRIAEDELTFAYCCGKNLTVMDLCN